MTAEEVGLLYREAPGEAAADILITCDNAFELYLNGQYIGAGGTWQTATAFANLPLLTGKNVIAVKGVDGGAIAGLLAETIINSVRHGSNADWKISTTEDAGWQDIDFNDTGWGTATEHGSYGIAPWGEVNGFAADSPAKWIWAQDLNGIDLAFFRYTFDFTGVFQPDLMIQGPADADYLGLAVHNDAPSQTSAAATATTAVYHVLVGNYGTATDIIKLTATPQPAGWTVKYVDERPGGGDCTAAITDPGGWSPEVPMGTAVPFRIEVTPGPAVKGGTKCTVTFSAVSTNDATKTDFVVAETTRLPLQSVSLAAVPVSPGLPNVPVAITATTVGGGTPEYKFQVGTIINGVTTYGALPATYTANPVFTWTPTEPGSYIIRVYAREQGTTLLKSATLPYTIKPVVSALALTVTPASPQPWTASITCTATPTGGAKPEYKFRAGYRDANNVLQWILLRDYAASATWTGKLPQDVARTYSIYAYVREQGTSVNYLLYSTSVTFITKAPLSDLQMTVTPTSPGLVGSNLTITAVPTGGAKLEYAFKATYYDAANTLVKLTLQDYSGLASWTGKLPVDAPRSYTLYVYAREQGTTIIYQMSATRPFVTKAPLSALNMSVSPASPGLLGANLTITAIPTGGAKLEYAFKATYYDAANTLVKLTLQDYSGLASWTGKLPVDAPRSYTLYVYAREQGTTIIYQMSATRPFVTKAPLSALKMSVSPASPGLLGANLTITAIPTGGAKLEYAYKATYLDATNTLQKLTLQDYLAAASWTGTLPVDAPRAYTLYVYAREQGTTVAYLKSVGQAYTTIPITVNPNKLTLRCGASQLFTATVGATANQAVTWTVRNSANVLVPGAIAADGTFVAPYVPGYYKIVATSVADPTQSGAASVTVLDQLPVAANLVLRFAANLGVTVTAGKVSAWADTSGANHHAAQLDAALRPTRITNTWNGQPIIRFNGSGQCMPVDGEFAVSQYFIVWRSTAAVFTNYGSPIGTNMQYPNGDYRPYLFESGTTFFHFNPYPRAVWKNGTGLLVPFDLGPVTAPMVMTISGANPEQLRSYLLGGTTDSGNYFIAMDVAEIIGFSVDLSDADRQAVEAYLKAKYGL